MGILSELSVPRMEGWLYVVRSNRLGLQSSRKRYFVIEDNALHCFKAMPSSKREDPIKSALMDSSMRVIDNGRESVHGNVLYIFTLKNASKGNDQLKLGARSSEEAACWIRSLMETILKERPKKEENSVDFSKRRWRSSRPNRGRRHTHSIDWTFFPSVHTEPMASDVIAPSTWQIVGCKNGIRLFKEARDSDMGVKNSNEPPAIMAVGVVDATSESVFQTVMSLGPSRSEWDFCLLEGNTVEHLDGHTDIIHKKLRADWLPWGMKQRDLLLRRYWRREDDGTYVILYHSVFHQNCRPEKDYIRAWIKSGGYVISPVNQGKQSVVKHMLAIDWKFWKSYLFTQSEKYITMRMLGRIAALREFFRAKLGNSTYTDFSSLEIIREMGSPENEKEHIKLEVQSVGKNSIIENSAQDPQSSPDLHSNTGEVLLPLNDAADEFFDVLNDSDYEQTEAFWSSDESVQSQLIHQDQCHAKLSPAAVFVKKLQAIAAQNKGYIELEEETIGGTTPCSYGSTLPEDRTCSMPCSWAMADPSTFLIRGQSYLHDHQKIKSNGTLMQMVAADWLSSDKREDDLGGRPGGIVQKYAERGGSEFFFIVNIQVPGSTMYNLLLYYMMNTPLENVPLLESFVKRDDTYRNSRFKLIPYISKGSWIVKQSVGKKAGLVGQALAINYFRGSNYIELGVDVGSSTVARGVVSLVLGCLNNLVIEMAFLIQANTQEELPEFLLGTCKLNHLDASKAVPVNSQ